MSPDDQGSGCLSPAPIGVGGNPHRGISLGEEPASGMLLEGEWVWGEVRKWPGFPLAHMQVTGVPGKDDLPPLYRGAPQGPPSPAPRVSAPNFLLERDLFRVFSNELALPRVVTTVSTSQSAFQHSQAKQLAGQWSSPFH